MKAKINIKTVILNCICFIYILLFVYAALNKILDFQNFQVQLGQSPLLSAFAGVVSYSVPLLEIIIAILLCFDKFRFIGLMSSFGIMIMFTTYIIIILNFSPFVPCSCGGIIENLTWTQHLIFNIAFALLGFFGVVLIPENRQAGKPRTNRIAIATALGSVTLISALFLISEETIRHKNNFVRRFPHHPLVALHELEIKHKTFYIAGSSGAVIYLGNTSAPLTVMAIDTGLTRHQFFRIKLPANNYSYRSVKVKVSPPYFYVYDGTVPCIFKGNISNWSTELIMHGDAYFSSLEPMTPDSFAIRATSSESRQNVLGTISIHKNIIVKLSDSILEKQIDGVFDTDGLLLYNQHLDKVLYTYYYRNEYFLIDSSLNTYSKGSTIDTTTHANIKVAHFRNSNESRLAAPAQIVNKDIAASGNYLFVNAGLMGKYEQEDMWEKASVIDVYNVANKTYAFSFYIHDHDGERMSDFAVAGDLIIALTGSYISTYKIKTGYYKNVIRNK